MFQVDKDLFLQKVILASSFISQKYSENAILQGILLEGEENKLKISSTNLNQYYQTVINIKTKKEFKIIIEPQKVIDFLSLLKPGEINVEIEKNKILINKNQAEGVFSLINYEDYPSFPRKTKDGQKIRIKELRESVERVIFSASKDETRAVLSGVFFDFDDENIFIVTTDGFRLSLLKIKKEINFTSSFIVSAGFLNNVLRFLKDEEVDFGFDIEENTIFLKSENDLFISRLIEGEYPPYNKVIPQTIKTSVFVDSEEFLRAVKLISVFVRDKSNIVVLEIKNNKILVRPKTEAGEAKTEIDAKTEGESLVVAFNSKFIIDFLRHLPDKKKQIIIGFTKSDAPVMFKEEENDNYLHIIMPVRIQE